MKKLHIIGIGGIGMSALAWIALEKGIEVSGSDAKESPLIRELRARGAKIFIGQKKENIEETLDIAYSSAIKETNPEWMRGKELGCRFFHRSELLSMWMEGKKQIVIAGCHGKTTTTSLMIHVLKEAGLDPSFVVGGVSLSLGQNGALGKGEYFVAEGDESDGSFLRTHPHIGIVTNMDPDHLDYWKTEEALDEAYESFIKKSEHLIYCIDDPKLKKKRGTSYGFSLEADLHLVSTQVIAGEQTMTFTYGGHLFKAIPMALFGVHNVLNSLAVFAAAKRLGISNEKIFQAFLTFKGVDRRMQLKGSVKGVTYIDDYAHHPTEVKATLQAMRAKMGDKKLVVVFQPHRFSRFETFMEEFAESLEGKETLIVTDIFGAGEENPHQLHALDLVSLLKKQESRHLVYAKRNELKEILAEEAKEGDTILAMGAGDITQLKDEMMTV